ELRGHCLIWHAYQPTWFNSITSATDMETAIVDHITNVLTYYKGKIKIWDVVNEAIDDSSTKTKYIFRNEFLYKALPNYVDVAFQTARKVDPNVKLFYNDYNIEGVWDKSTAVYLFVKDLLERGIPIDGVGLQYHVSVQYQPTLASITDVIGKYCELGLEVHITELDVKCEDKCNASNVNELQNTTYSNALKACLRNSCCTAFLVWGISDD
ncbi:glycoside hydrolase family 10 protein, partial [Piromyces sp. E2]